MTPSTKTFRLQFLLSPTEPAGLLGERDVLAADLDAAIWKAADVTWPSGAGACRLSDDTGREVAYLVGADRNGGGVAGDEHPRRHFDGLSASAIRSSIASRSSRPSGTPSISAAGDSAQLPRQ